MVMVQNAKMKTSMVSEERMTVTLMGPPKGARGQLGIKVYDFFLLFGSILFGAVRITVLFCTDEWIETICFEW